VLRQPQIVGRRGNCAVDVQIDIQPFMQFGMTVSKGERSGTAMIDRGTIAQNQRIRIDAFFNQKKAIIET
jgi:hypothetical protein